MYKLHVIFSVLCLTLYHNSVKADTLSWLECSEDANCPSADSKCIDNLCQCGIGFVFNTEVTQCLPIITQYGGSCEDTNQCQWLLGEYECSEGQCICKKGWKYLFGKCMKTRGLGSSCEINENCFDEVDFDTMFCDNGVCNCKDTHYARGEYDCRRRASEGEPCSLHTDCDFPNSYCEKTCKTNATTEYKEYKSNFHYMINGVEDKIAAQLVTPQELDICDTNEDCTNTYTNAICYPLTKKCVCNRGYFLSSKTGKCEIELHSTCQTPADCEHIGASICLENRCKCNLDRWPALTNDQCKIMPTSPALKCSNTFVGECYIFGINGVCNAERSCTCNLNSKFDAALQYCVENVIPPGVCVTPDDCVDIPDSTCQNGACVCKDGFVDDGSLKCLPVATEVGGPCLITLQCQNLQNTECVEGICDCNKNSALIDDICYENKAIGSQCITLSECHRSLHNSTQCRNGICQCPIGEVYAAEEICRSGALTPASCYLLVISLILLIFNFQEV